MDYEDGTDQVYADSYHNFSVLALDKRLRSYTIYQSEYNSCYSNISFNKIKNIFLV